MLIGSSVKNLKNLCVVSPLPLYICTPVKSGGGTTVHYSAIPNGLCAVLIGYISHVLTAYSHT